MKRLLSGIGLALVAVLLLPLIVLAFTWSVDYTITESSGNAYTSVGVFGSSNNTYYASQGYINANGLNTHVYAGNATIPHMLTTDRTFWAMTIPALNTQTVTYALGDTAVSSFSIIPGYDGYITTPDDASLELGSAFDLTISGYVMPYTGAGQNLWYKSGAGKLDVSAASTVTFHALNADNTDNWTLTGAAAPGAHTFRVYSDGTEASLYVDGVEVDSEILFTSNFDTVGAISSTPLVAGKRFGYYAEGFYWQFYITSTNNIAYVTSTDGASWNAPIDITTDNVATALRVTTYFDGTYVHYARRVDNTHISYRRGLPVNDGTITWSAVEQDVGIDGQTLRSFGNLSMAVSSTGHPQIAYLISFSGVSKVGVVKATTNDGTWTTAATYPQYFVGATAWSGLPYLEALPDGDMYLVFSETSVGGVDSKTFGRYFNGSTWSGTNDTFKTDGGGPVSLIGDDDGNVYVTYDGTSTQRGKVRYSNGSLGSETDLGISVTYKPTLTYDPGADSVWMFHNAANKTYYRRYVIGTGTWEAAVELNTTSLDNMVLSSYSRVFGNHIGIGSTLSGNLYHQYLAFPWSWNDNANDHVWMGGNSMSYADNMTLSVGGTQVLRYQPDSIISGTTLPDESGNGNDGIFTFGGLPAGVGVILSAFVGNAPARAPAWAVTGSEPDWVATANMSGGFNTTVSPKGPFAQIIIDAATAGATPSQLPFMILTLVVILAISFLISYVWRKAGANSPLWAKGILCLGMIGIAVSLQYWDWWMLFFYIIFFAALGLASRHQSFSS